MINALLIGVGGWICGDVGFGKQHAKKPCKADDQDEPVPARHHPDVT